MEPQNIYFFMKSASGSAELSSTHARRTWTLRLVIRVMVKGQN